MRNYLYSSIRGDRNLSIEQFVLNLRTTDFTTARNTCAGWQDFMEIYKGIFVIWDLCFILSISFVNFNHVAAGSQPGSWIKANYLRFTQNLGIPWVIYPYFVHNFILAYWNELIPLYEKCKESHRRTSKYLFYMQTDNYFKQGESSWDQKLTKWGYYKFLSKILKCHILFRNCLLNT